jgi:hypothetical protein
MLSCGVDQAGWMCLDQVGGGEVPDPVPSGDGGDAEGDEQVGLAGAGRSDQAHVLVSADPLQRVVAANAAAPR